MDHSNVRSYRYFGKKEIQTIAKDDLTLLFTHFPKFDIFPAQRKVLPVLVVPSRGWRLRGNVSRGLRHASARPRHYLALHSGAAAKNSFEQM